MSEPTDEFAWIASLRPLTLGDHRALNLEDDAAVIPGRPGWELVISKDAMVEGVHFLSSETGGVVAQRLIRTALSDLAAKAAEPFGYFLMAAWPKDRDLAYRTEFIQGLSADGVKFGIALLGGDTVSTTGPLTLSVTVLGWAPEGRTILRSGALIGDSLVVCGFIGDGRLGLEAATGKISDPGNLLANHYRLPMPLLSLRTTLTANVRAAADVSDGLLSDAEHIAAASRLGLTIELDRLRVSPAAGAWLDSQPDRSAARLSLATGGDDYALVCAVAPERTSRFIGAVEALGIPAAVAGLFKQGQGLDVTDEGKNLDLTSLGWRH
jgi:thiamine-monophosphate kinase